MQLDPKFIKIQPSNGIIKDKQGRTKGLVWIFRPDVAVEDQHWFEACDTNADYDFLCVETGSDGFPVNCKQVYLNSDGPPECIPIADQEILKCFEFCCGLLNKKKAENNEMQHLGGEILKDMISGEENNV